MNEKVVWNALWRLRQELDGFMEERGKEFEFVHEFWLRCRKKPGRDLSGPSGEVAEGAKAEKI